MFRVNVSQSVHLRVSKCFDVLLIWFEVYIRWSVSYFLFVFLVHTQLLWILHHVLLFSMLVFKQTILL